VITSVGLGYCTVPTYLPVLQRTYPSRYEDRALHFNIDPPPRSQLLLLRKYCTSTLRAMVFSGKAARPDSADWGSPRPRLGYSTQSTVILVSSRFGRLRMETRKWYGCYGSFQTSTTCGTRTRSMTNSQTGDLSHVGWQFQHSNFSFLFLNFFFSILSQVPMISLT
jgi:hypothetical protein